MRLLRSLVVSFISVCGALSLLHCGDDGGCEPGAPCYCSNARGCVYHCPESGCLPVCNDVVFCQASCGDHCGYQCNNVRDCEVSCGAGCDASCNAVSNCRVDVGPGSSVQCTSLQNCDVHCAGSCEVSCSDVGACNVSCRSGAATQCSGGRRVCGGSC